MAIGEAKLQQVQYYFSVKLIQSLNLNSCFPYIFKLRIQLHST